MSANVQTPVHRSQASEAIKRTPLHAIHARLGAKFCPFAGYEMPLSYPAGVLKEHVHTRAAAGLFDVSHMGQIELRPRTGDVADVAAALEGLVPVDVCGLRPGRQRYALFTDRSGGILDDLMIARLTDRLTLVVNAAVKGADKAHLRGNLPADVEIAVLDRSLVALQGPSAERALARLAPTVTTMRFMDVLPVEIAGADCLVTRSGYTGEDGFEIAIPADRVEEIASALLDDESVAPVGLAARDSLRLEAGLCLYGSDIDAKTSPVAAGLSWAISPARRTGGAREGRFPGAERILDELRSGPSRLRVGLLPEERAPVRAGAALYADEASDEPIGLVTSGGFGPTLQAPVAMGYLPTAVAVPGGRVFAELRGRRLAVKIAPTPFVTPKFRR